MTTLLILATVEALGSVQLATVSLLTTPGLFPTPGNRLCSAVRGFPPALESSEQAAPSEMSVLLGAAVGGHL